MKKMKFTLLLAIAAISFMFTGCKEEETPAPKNIVQIAQSDENFSILVQAVVRAGLVDALSAEGPLTVFAPTNAAFAALLEELDVESLDDISDELLIDVLKYHVVSGKVLAGDLSDEQEVAPILGDNQTFTIDLTGGAKKIVDANDRVANITTTDIEASNGVIHVIDKVILPSFPK